MPEVFQQALWIGGASEEGESYEVAVTASE
jgi:hypothetical protein